MIIFSYNYSCRKKVEVEYLHGGIMCLYNATDRAILKKGCLVGHCSAIQLITRQTKLLQKSFFQNSRNHYKEKSVIISFSIGFCNCQFIYFSWKWTILSLTETVVALTEKLMCEKLTSPRNAILVLAGDSRSPTSILVAVHDWCYLVSCLYRSPGSEMLYHLALASRARLWRGLAPSAVAASSR